MAIDKGMIQGSMTVLILRLLQEKDMYGYEITDTLKKRSNDIFECKAGSLYPMLHSLETQNYVESYEDESSGKKRKYYHLTREGENCLQKKKQEWEAYQKAMSEILAMQFS